MKMNYYNTDVVSRNEYDQVVHENDRLRDAISQAKDLAKYAWHDDSIEDAQYHFSEIERILEVV